MSIVVSGSMRAGKSFLLENRLGLSIRNVPDPMYAITEHYFGTTDKSLPGIRSFMQQIGQWGRGLVNEEYPATPERGAVVAEVRENGDAIIRRHAEHPAEYVEVDWREFGRNPGFWVDVLSSRLQFLQEEGRDEGIGVPNARFPNEIIELAGTRDLDYYHVMCSPGTRRARVDGDMEEQDSDSTEAMAQELNSLAANGDHILEAVYEGSDDYPMLSELRDAVPDLLDRVAFGDCVVWSDPHRPVPRGRDYLTPADLEDHYL